MCPEPKQMSNPVSDVLSGAEKMSPEQWADFVDKTSATVLRKQFSREANSHRNMKLRAKAGGFVVHPDFEDWKSFLRIMGPAPTKTATVDRIAPHDPEYAPGKVRWADKAVQASNKTCTIIINDPDTGEAWTIARLAKHRGLSPEALRKQRARGASDYELIHGKPSSTLPSSSEPAPASKQAYLDSLPRPLYSDHVDVNLIRLSTLWMAIADKFQTTWSDVNHIEGQLFDWFPEIKDRFFDLDFIPPRKVGYPVGRWKQLFDMFPIALEHVNAVNDYFICERVHGGRAKVEARHREERRALADKEAEDRKKWEEWEGVRCMNELPDLSQAAWEHLCSLGEHPLDAWRLYCEMHDNEEVRALDFDGFVMRLEPDEGDAPSGDQLRRRLALEIGPQPSFEREILNVEADFDPTDCSAPPEVDDEDQDEEETEYEDEAASMSDREESDAFEDEFWRSGEDEE